MCVCCILYLHWCFDSSLELSCPRSFTSKRWLCASENRRSFVELFLDHIEFLHKHDVEVDSSTINNTLDTL